MSRQAALRSKTNAFHPGKDRRRPVRRRRNPRCGLGRLAGGYYYAVQYDYREFFSIADGKTFQVILAGNPFPAMNPDDVANQLLPQMQAGKPQPNLTFTYDKPLEPPHPWYRLYLIADAANDLEGLNGVCATGNVPTLQAMPSPSNTYLFAIYCRNEHSPCRRRRPGRRRTGPTDPRIAELFRQLFQVIWSDSPGTAPHRSAAATGGSLCWDRATPWRGSQTAGVPPA